MKGIKYILGILLMGMAMMMAMPMTVFAEANKSGKKFTLVIDAGHGGGDAGAIGKAGVKEKNLTLKFALAFGKMVEQNCPDVKVVYTRKTDKFVELYRRAEIANQNKADLFISVHINAVPKGHIVRGFQTYTLGKSRRTGKKTGVLENLEVAKRENAVIYQEKNFEQRYQGFDPNSPESMIIFDFVQDKNMENSIELAKYMQKYVCKATGRQDMGAHQDNLAVLRLTSMPGCLIELGFISTPDEEKYMNSDLATGQYARGIYNAFVAYKNHFFGGVNVPFKVQEPIKEEPKQQVKEEPKVEKVAEPELKQEERQEDSANTDSVVAVAPEEAPEPVKLIEPVKTTEPTKPVKTAEPVKSVVDKSQVNSKAPVFKVQILTTSKKLSPNDARLKGLKNTDCYTEGGMQKYTVGSSTDYNEIYRLRKSILDKFPEAFIIAFKNGARMDVQQAIREFKNNKK